MLVQVTHTPKWSLTFRTFIPPVLMLHSYVAPSALFVGISLVTEVAWIILFRLGLSRDFSGWLWFDY